jgi:hypothetical protein
MGGFAVIADHAEMTLTFDFRLGLLGNPFEFFGCLEPSKNHSTYCFGWVNSLYVIFKKFSVFDLNTICHQQILDNYTLMSRRPRDPSCIFHRRSIRFDVGAPQQGRTKVHITA